jgi:hypothetical protein
MIEIFYLDSLVDARSGRPFSGGGNTVDISRFEIESLKLKNAPRMARFQIGEWLSIPPP